MNRRLPSTLRIAWPYRDHDDLQWYKNPLRVIVPPFAGITGKFIIKNFNHMKVYNEERFVSHLNPDKPRERGLITYANHQCTIDDCFVWQSLPYSFHFQWMKHRWVLGSADICFHKFLHHPFRNWFLTWFFTAGKTIPVTHGTGVYQDGIDFAIERLKRCEWVNLYPEGQVNKEGGWMRFYWGIGRMILESYPNVPLVLPFYHIGLDKLYPPTGPNKYSLQKDRPITMLVGEALDLTETIEKLKAEYTDDLDIIEKLTNILQEKLFEMRLECIKLHREHLNSKKPEEVDAFDAEFTPLPEHMIGRTQNFDKIYQA